MELKLVHLERQGNLAILTLTRPEKLNALNPQMLNDLETALIELKADRTVRVVIITGDGEKAFVAG
ncbi:MAG: enoyl-CoA hydratase/isomerase family protein, partial [Candidatus Marinimicrobia bacterium]|nr:enoyl-CoA hydratase/isomerase family protein [Candidatus Neomarinimicrobiota bacterium]MCF7800926.1 enoyl-CoA hydratase/isomerase family protein [Candidatus Neomarinimicrobiota bacterium]